MKKLLTFILCACLLLTACASGANEPVSGDHESHKVGELTLSSGDGEQTPPETSAETEATEPVTEPATEPATESTTEPATEPTAEQT